MSDGTEKVIQDLRKSLAWLDLALATLNEGVLVLDGDMKVLFANDALANMIKKQRILLLGLFVWDALPLHKEDVLIYKRQYQKLLKSNTVESLNGTYKLDGTSKASSIELSVAHIENTQQTVLVVRDISVYLQAQAQRTKIIQEKAARAAAQLSEQRTYLQYKVASILAASPSNEDVIPKILKIVCESLSLQAGTFWMINIETKKLYCSNSWTDSSDKMCRFVEVSKEQRLAKGEGLPGRIWQNKKAIWVEDITKELNFPRRIAAHKLGLHGAFAIPIKTGHSFIGVMEFFSNRTEKQNTELLTSMATIGIQIAQFMRRKTIENALIHSEDRFRTMFEQSPLSMQLLSPEGKTLMVNKAWEELWGSSFNQIKDHNMLEDKRLIESDIMPYIKKGFEGEPSLVPAAKYKQYNVSENVTKAPYHWIQAYIYPVKGKKGAVREVVLVHEDITDSKQHADEMHKAYELLKSQQKELEILNQSKDEFIALASHQLRTPATAIKQLLGLFVEGIRPSSADSLDIIKKAYDSNQRQLNIVNSLLKVAQVDSGHVILRKTKTNIAKLLQNIADELSETFTSRSQTIKIALKTKAPLVFVDEQYMRMALENIVGNASKYTHHGGSISIVVSKEKDLIKISIVDSGIGITKSDIYDLFGKFKRIPNELSDKVGGVGLGLYWANKVIGLHGGNIDVESEPGKGTTFNISLPQGDEESSE